MAAPHTGAHTNITRLTLFVPGPRGKTPAVESEWVANPGDHSFARAFGFGTVSEDKQRAIDSAPGAWVLSCPFDLREGRKEAAALVEQLAQAGALAVRVEQSKLGWDIERWLELVSSGDGWSLHRAVVVILENEEFVQSCGMHAFSLPDARTEPGGRDLISTFNTYQIDEEPLLSSGHTFAPDAKTPRRALQRWPDDGYPPSSPCHNPYGIWRMGPPGGQGRRAQPELRPVFVPSLVAVLAALEQNVGKPLTRVQVEEATSNGVCVAMEQRDAQTLERSRGYADIDPEFAWEQWQLVRAQLGR
jgi:hypothetical protein